MERLLCSAQVSEPKPLSPPPPSDLQALAANDTDDEEDMLNMGPQPVPTPVPVSAPVQGPVSVPVQGPVGPAIKNVVQDRVQRSAPIIAEVKTARNIRNKIADFMVYVVSCAIVSRQETHNREGPMPFSDSATVAYRRPEHYESAKPSTKGTKAMVTVQVPTKHLLQAMFESLVRVSTSAYTDKAANLDDCLFGSDPDITIREPWDGDVVRHMHAVAIHGRTAISSDCRNYLGFTNLIHHYLLTVPATVGNTRTRQRMTAMIEKFGPELVRLYVDYVRALGVVVAMQQWHAPQPLSVTRLIVKMEELGYATVPMHTDTILDLMDCTTASVQHEK